MKVVRSLVIVVLTVAAFAFLTATSQKTARAVPPFARKTDLACSKCHTAFPRLNSFGRQYKLNGYVRDGEKEEQQEVTEDFEFEKAFSAGAVYKLRPYDKKKGSNYKLRAAHEVEIFLAGSAGGEIGKNISFFGELEAEEENTNAMGWDIGVAMLKVGFHPSEQFNLVLGNMTVSSDDPFQNVSNEGRLTRDDRKMWLAGQSSGAIMDDSQSVHIYGTTAERALYYAIGLSADSGDSEGAGPKDISARLAYTFPGTGFTMGVYGADGKQSDGAGGSLDYSRFDVDLHYEADNFTIVGGMLKYTDDMTAGGAEEKNDGFYIEALYRFLDPNHGDRPTWVPNIRYDSVEKTNGTSKSAQMVFNLSYFFRENGRVFVEYMKQTKVPGTGTKSNRLTIQAEIGL